MSHSAVAWLAKNGVRAVTEGDKYSRPGWAQVECPWCGKGTGKLGCGINLDGGYANCWKCGPHSLWSLLKELTGVRPPGDILQKEFRPRVDEDTAPKGVYAPVPLVQRPFLKCQADYLKGRGFDPKAVQKIWSVRGCPPHGRYAYRLFVPVLQGGREVSWTTRAVTDAGPNRYLAAPPDMEEVPVKHTLYGEDYVRHAVVVHEGPTDVWRTGPGAVCTYGTAVSAAQVLRLSRYPIRAVCFDSGKDARRRAEALADQLCAFPGRTDVVDLDADDPGSAAPSETRKLRAAYLD